MMVGETFSGKTSIINVLQHAMSSIQNNPDFTKVSKKTLNPKAITQY